MATYPKQISFTLTFSKTVVYIMFAAMLFLASFIVAANAQQQIYYTTGSGVSGGGTITTLGGSYPTTVCCVTSGPYQNTKEPVKENQHLFVWKWLAMISTFGAGVFFSIKAFETFNNK